MAKSSSAHRPILHKSVLVGFAALLTVACSGGDNPNADMLRVPGPPREVFAVAADGKATVSWKAPTRTGDAPVTKYVVRSVRGGHVVESEGTKTSVVFDGLTNREEYAFTVTAFNKYGAGATSRASNPVIPDAGLSDPTPPDPPTNVKAVAGNKNATVTWDAPAFDGGSPVLHYVVVVVPGNVEKATDGDLTGMVFEGLENGVAYSFRVKAINAIDESDLSLPSPVVTPREELQPATVPDAPTNVVATAGSASADVTWAAPEHDGGSPILRYRVTAMPGEEVVEASATSRTARFRTLTVGTGYTFTVIAENAVGASLPSEPSNEVVPYARPDAPTEVVAAAGDGRATVTWAAVAGVETAPVTGYFVYVHGAEREPLYTTEVRAVVTDLPNGVPVSFDVSAVSIVGESVRSARSNVVTPLAGLPPPASPGAPTGVRGVAGDSLVTVSWNAPASDGGSPIQGYLVQTGSVEHLAKASPFVFRGLANGTSYAFTVRALNAEGIGPGSLPSAPVRPGAVTVPQAPGKPTAVAGRASATISWTAPASGGRPVESYRVTSSEGRVQTTTGTRLVFTGLTNEVAYTFTVTAVNARGESSPSPASAPVTPSAAAGDPTPPGAPTSVMAVPGDARALVSWTPPAATGSSALAGYQVRSSSGAVRFTTATSIEFDGLTNGSSYYFFVRAANFDEGFGPESERSNDVTPTAQPNAQLPSEPLSVWATGDDGAALITWLAPESPGTGALVGYVVTSSRGESRTVPASATSLLFTGLENEHRYSFTVTASNATGAGPASTPSDAVLVTRGVPGKPTHVQGTPGDRRIFLTWTTPENAGQSPVSGYRVRTDSGLIRYVKTPAIDFDGLSNGLPYRFTVEAINAQGAGPASDETLSLSPYPPTDPPTSPRPSAPLHVGTVAGDAMVTVSWSPPSEPGGTPVRGYIVRTGERSVVAPPDARSVDFTGLTNGTAYSFTVTASNDAGPGLTSTPTLDVTPTASAGRPSAPFGVEAIAGNGLATVRWSSPTRPGSSPITGYEVVTLPLGDVTAVPASSNSITVDALENRVEYRFVVRARNEAGVSPDSTPSNAVTPTDVAVPPARPSAPRNVAAIATDGGANVSWLPPDSNGGTFITRYQVTASDGRTLSASETQLFFSGLENGRSYTFTVRAEGAAGQGQASAPSNPVRPLASPSAPRSLSLLAGNGAATVYWLSPAQDGGAPIVGYRVQVEGYPDRIVGGPPVRYDGLTNGHSHTFKVSALNRAGLGPEAQGSVTPTASPSNVSSPGAVRDLSAAQDGHGRVRVTWKAPSSNGGAPISGYIVRTSGHPESWTEETTALVTGLEIGIPRTFTVRAVNAAGTGPAATSPSVTPASSPPVTGEPTAVRNLELEPGVLSVTARWDAPASGGATDYYVTLNGAEGRVVGASRTTTFTNLSPGLSYVASVRARNAVGFGPPTSTSPASPLRAPARPGEPRNVKAWAGDSSATIAWDAPADDGGSAIQGYFIDTDGDTVPARIVAGSPVVFEGLTNGLKYNFRVRAINTSRGDGVRVNAPAVTPTAGAPAPGQPGAAQDVVAVAGPLSATVSWLAPASDGNGPITGYLVAEVGAPPRLLPPSARSYEFRPLDSTKTYSFTVSAVSDRGAGPSTTSNEVTPAPATSVPARPVIVSATAGNGTATVAWTPPANDGGAPVIDYLVKSTAGDYRVTGATHIVMYGLQNDQVYRFTVRARNAFGTGAESELSAEVTPRAPVLVPAAPTDVRATSGDQSIRLEWTQPEAPVDAPVLGYEVERSEGAHEASFATEYFVVGLQNGQDYSFRVRAFNAHGRGEWSAPSDSVTPAGTPDAPIAVTASPGNGQATVEWNPPEETGGVPIDYYLVRTNDETPDLWTKTSDTSIIIRNLVNGESYRFQVQAVNKEGVYGYMSEPSNTVVPQAGLGRGTSVPETPALVLEAKAQDGWVKASWSLSVIDATNQVLTAYSATGEHELLGAFELSADATDWVHHTNWSGDVELRLEVGRSNDASEESIVTLRMPEAPSAAVAPSAPRALRAALSSTDGTLSVSWETPRDEGDSFITGYTLRLYADPSAQTPVDYWSLPAATTHAVVEPALSAEALFVTVTATNTRHDSVETDPVAVQSTP